MTVLVGRQAESTKNEENGPAIGIVEIIEAVFFPQLSSMSGAGRNVTPTFRMLSTFRC